MNPKTDLEWLLAPQDEPTGYLKGASNPYSTKPDYMYNPGSSSKPYPIKPGSSSPSKYTIAQLVKVCWPAYIKEKLSGKNFNSWGLNKLEANGNLKITPLGPSVSGSSKGFQELCVGISWTAKDDHINKTENQQVSFVLALFNNAMDSHDEMLLKEIGKKHAVVSKEYKYKAGEIQQAMDSQTYFMKLYTAFALLDTPKPKSKSKSKPKSK